MDSTPTQSTSKCIGSDFSIERILSDDSRSSREHIVEVPNWLCCTRYRPPRLPRSVNSGGCRSRRSGRHARVPFTAAQAAALEAAYARAPYLAPPALRALAAALQLRDDRIKIWFQNRRARERREKCANITPPLAVTLPATTSARTSSITPSNSWIDQQDSELANLSHHRIYTARADNEDSLSSTESTHEFTAAFPVHYNSSYSDEVRSESPLDIESIDD